MIIIQKNLNYSFYKCLKKIQSKDLPFLKFKKTFPKIYSPKFICQIIKKTKVLSIKKKKIYHATIFLNVVSKLCKI
jgi:hypothetical protein